MTLLAYLAGSDQAHHIRLNDFGLTTHADGSVGFGGIVFDDEDGTLLVRGWMEVLVVEDECTDAPILFRGWIGDRQYVRQAGQGQTYRAAVGRYIDSNIVDPNDALVIRLFTNPDAKRPAETDIRRINWLLGAADPGGLDGLVADLGLVDRSTPRPFQDADWRGQYARDVLDDLAAPLGRIFFVYINQPDGALGLFYDFPTSTVLTSDMSISNVIADNGPQCLYPFIDAVLHRDPSNMISLERFVYRNGVVLEGNTTTQADYFSAAATGGLNLGNRGDNVSNDRVGLEATARTMADGNLAKNGVERDTLTVTVIIPAAQVGLIDVGQRVAVKFSHLDLEGYGDFVYVRVVARQVQQYVTNDNYVVTYELSNDGLRESGGGGGTGPGDFPQPPTAPPTIVQQKFQLIDAFGNVTLDQTPTVGNWLIMGVGSRGTSITLPASPVWTEHPHGQITPGSDYGRLAYRPVDPGDTTAFEVVSVGGTYAQVWEVSGIDGTLDASSFADVDTFTQPASIDAGTMTPTSGSPAIMFALLVMACSNWAGNGPTTMSTPSGWTLDGEYEVTNSGDLHPNIQSDSRIETATSGSYIASSTIAGAGFNFGGWGGLALAFLGSAGSNPPQPGQDVPWEVVTMTTVNGVSVGTTVHPYADRSLLVKVDGVLISTASYTETDPSCGDFALTWEIDPDEVVSVQYQGR